MISNEMAQHIFELIATYEAMYLDDQGDFHTAQLNESYRINECRTMEHYLNQEMKTEAALRRILHIIGSDLVNDETKVRCIKELVEWRLL